MSAVCPLGHTSDSTDYCDTCGSPIGSTEGGGAAASGAGMAGSSAAGSPDPVRAGGDGAAGGIGSGSEDSGGATPTPTTQRCPNCDTVNVMDALFCEACGYDFTTGVMPRPIALADGSYLAPIEPVPSAEAAEPELSAEPEESVGSAESAGPGEPDQEASSEQSPTPPQPDEPHEPDEREHGSGPVQPTAPGSDAGAPGITGGATPTDPAPDDDAADPHLPEAPIPAATPDAPPAPHENSTPAPTGSDEMPGSVQVPPGPVELPSGKLATYRPPSRETARDWIVEVWIDPDWYAVQDSSEPCPSPGIPEIVPLHDGALVGRPSASRRIRPDIDVGTDTGVSRRQALLTTDGHRWWVEDLDSANGTFVGPASGALPVDPITSRVEVDADDRIYVGAWTRLVVRPATDSERAGQG